MKKKSRLKNDVEQDLVEGLEEFVADLKAGKSISEKYTCRQLVLDLKPTPYSSKEVKATRQLLKLSQSLFAEFLGVSLKTVCAWEQGQPPSEMARRFMDEIQRNPDYWRRRLSQAARVKTG